MVVSAALESAGSIIESMAAASHRAQNGLESGNFLCPFCLFARV
jgi:hypothetical protein